MTIGSQIAQLFASASSAHAAGRLGDATRLTEQVLSLDPQHVQANLLQGVLAAKAGRDDFALQTLETLHQRVPDSFETVFWLSILHRRRNRLAEAIKYAETGVRLRPADAHALNNLGLCYMDSLRLEEAAESFQKAVSIRQDMSPIFHNLGTVLYKLGQDNDAIKAFDQAVLLSPRSVESLLGLGQTLISQTNPGDAVKAGQMALAIDPNSAAAHLLLASALVEDSRPLEAEKHLRRSIELNPGDAQAQALLGLRLQTLGRFSEANERLKKSLELEPNQGFAYFSQVFNNKISELDGELTSKMLKLAKTNSLPPREQAFLEYGLGKAYENLGVYESAIRHFDKANELSRKIKFGKKKFDREAYVRSFDWLIETFSKEVVEANGVEQNQSELPIVIVGMMRSGTTLIEQILSSHAKVGPAGEQRFWPQNRRRLLGDEKDSLQCGQFRQLGVEYVDRLKKVAPGNERVTDKMPANYELAGPIHMALPNAKIIHMRRHPVDVCISIWTTPNRVPIEFAYDRENIVLAYRQYHRLMAHWRTVLPKDRFLEVEYESLILDREDQIKRVVDFLGLEWSDALLHHEMNERNVVTPSSWQVRQPIYSSSVERWKRYEPWLGVFRSLLQDEE